MHNDDLIKRAVLGQFDLAYLPLIETATGRVIGVEALSRWGDASGGWLHTESVMRQIEGTSVEPAYVRQLLGKVARDWELMVEVMRGMVMAINVSPYAFTLELVDDIQRHWPETRLLEVELTERMRVYDYGHVDGVVECMRNLGIAVSLDDYSGTPYCVSKMVGIEVDCVKLDKSVLTNLKSDRYTFTNATRLAKSMGCQITAEGVETLDHLRIVSEAGVDKWQGYLATKPLFISELLAWLKDTECRFDLPEEKLQSA
ncbi:EAL domain-containing protein [Gulbenkiania mobilis]|uniref:EAL domain-containing protein n=1 Tax=Gulbenkiania mobilis TaxID=397457 RepID=UPI0006BBC92B|nr:EAL domain-containing protein [Gulbenkiania mobilis]